LKDLRGNIGPRKRPEPRATPNAKTMSYDDRLGRFLVFVLRHHPEKIGLKLDEKGFIDIDTLVRALQKRTSFKDATRKGIERLAASTSSGNRFEIAGSTIRARYGHSLPQSVVYEPSTPPAILYYGTTDELAKTILKDGLKGTQTKRVHLSSDVASAKSVGQRRTPNPVIIKVDTALAAKAGVLFYAGGPSVWLSDDIPTNCLSLA
jgi:putative RNA 2'-phosphotransferase